MWKERKHVREKRYGYACGGKGTHQGGKGKDICMKMEKQQCRERKVMPVHRNESVEVKKVRICLWS
jgi:hypothetical protein